MTEQENKEKEEEKKEEPEETEEEKAKEVGDKAAEESAASSSLIDEATKAAELMKIENDRKEKLLDREEKLQVMRTLGGKAEAGAPPETEEEKVIRESKEILKGTGLDFDL